MTVTTKVSSKFQVVIPKAVRERHSIEAGQTLQVVSRGDMIALVPLHPVQSVRGILKGVDLSGYREKEDRP